MPNTSTAPSASTPPEQHTLFGTPERRVDIRTVDSLMFPYFQAWCTREKKDYTIGLGNAASYEIINAGISSLKKVYPDVTILDHGNTVFLLNEIMWIKDCHYLEEAEYQSADRRGLMRGRGGSAPQKLQKNSDTRQAVFRLMEYYDRALRGRGVITFSDMRLLALGEIRNNPKRRYTHIIADESQDLTRVQLSFLKAIYNPKEYASIIFIIDTAQSIYPQSWLGNHRSFASIGFNMTGKGNTLSKNFRTTTQISQAAYSLIDICPDIVEDENFVKPFLIDKQGEFPVCRSFRGARDQCNFVAERIRRHLADFKKSDIAIIARTHRQLEEIKTRLKKHQIDCGRIDKQTADFEADTVKLMTLHSIKGLEFPVVFMIGLDDGIIPYLSSDDPDNRSAEEIKERRLFYVGMTRATDVLYLLSTARPSLFIGDIDGQYLRLDHGCRLRRFYNIAVEDYRFRTRLQNVYSTEEKVRQWMIAELMHTYGYPLQAIHPEYGLNRFSRKGLVDIAVVVPGTGNSRPLIFIEVKQPGTGITGALDQVKSYMAHCPSCAFGLATDGNDLTIIDRHHERVADIPRFSQAMLPSGLRVLRFHDLKTRKDYRLSLDINHPVEMEIKRGDRQAILQREEFNAVPVYGKIAAGVPLEMNPEMDETCYLPFKWQRGGRYFILAVQGDSMINAGIENGDMVFVRAQPSADNLDIVVAAIDGDATLKRYHRMGASILLTAENPAYDPIQVEEEGVQILGIAIGVLRTETGF
jgi:DNA helicase-2/ATP-dependent DNA helicase PcrA